MHRGRVLSACGYGVQQVDSEMFLALGGDFG